MTQRIFLSPPHLTGNELDSLREALEKRYLAPAGPTLAEFEADVSNILHIDPQTKRVVALNSGTAAIHLALILAGVGPGDSVLCSDLTFIASIAPASYLGASAMFADAHPDTWNLDPERVREAFDSARTHGRRIKAVVAVHLYGRPIPPDHIAIIRELCREHDAALIEDAAETLGATSGGVPTGALGDFGVLSFNGNKIVTCSGGGALVCPDEETAQRALSLATMAKDPAPHYEHSAIGYSYRMPNVLAAIGRAQLPHLEERMAQRKAVRDWYMERLAGLPIQFIPEPEDAAPNWWLTCVTFDNSDSSPTGHARREAVRMALAAADIESRPLWKPMHMQPVFAGAQAYLNPTGSVGADLFARGLCLPSGSTLTERDVDRVTGVVRAALG
ncbi:pyridoxal phosphate-dependent aminotransferase [Oceanidesulfovibrio indonesiensis]|uniref:Pyridoxal phosphate-dependent aminotransferase n=1 Tax=Oceanidesulfovibrio indonesiensis TaxID=54767 RepID=A0A7M3MG23_9BACT|nr:aminotransferase class I/II-fold pyridoxal phosphate-dependent enzyme [Oceanidesulfovibrio indonesiensis]TVM17698.1 pyridoxal phosphate-dependent aminotransferase [Oceanidesulfovibrio indonesiensis]